MNTRVLTVPASARGLRLDRFLGEALREAGISREKIKAAVAAGQATRNGAVCAAPKTPVFPGDVITVAVAAPADSLAPEHGEVALLYRDEEIAVLNKPAGLTVHPAPGRPEGTLAHRLVRLFPELAEQGGQRPGIVHRLDKDTSGLMLVALTEKARLRLAGAFAAREVQKEYLALVRGTPRPASGDINAPVGRHPTIKTKMAVLPPEKGGRAASSSYRTLHADPRGRFALLAVAIHTGRTHQIRVHCAHAGHPLIGDTVYGGPEKTAFGGTVPFRAGNAAARQMLHAWKLRFTHPESGEEMDFTCPPPPDFTAAVRILAAAPQRIVVTGSAGCGKSSLIAVLRDAGLPAWSADDCVRRMYAAGGDGAYLLRGRYGPRFVPDEKAAVDKAALFAAMRESDTLRREVERLIHPLVRCDLESFRALHESRPDGPAATVAEIPLYLESGWRGRDGGTASRHGQDGTRGPSAKTAAPAAPDELLVGIYCPFAVRKQRMMRSRGWSEETIAAMEAWQWPEDKKIRVADLVLDNSGSPEDLRRRAASLVRVLARLRERAATRASNAICALWEDEHA